MKTIISLSGLLLCLAAGLLAADSEKSLPEESIHIQGSTTIGPIMDGFIEKFRQQRPHVKFTVTKNGSGDGAAALIEGKSPIAMMSRFMKPSEFKKAVNNGVLPTPHLLAMDAVAIIVNPANPVNNLTLQKVRDIYAGKITNWKTLGGADLPIIPVSRDISCGTYETFNRFVMKGEKMGSAVEFPNSSGPQMYSRVQTAKGAIGYVGLGFVDKNVKALNINGIKPSQRTIASGTYPIARPLFLFTDGYPQPGSLIHAICTFHLSPAGQKVIEAKGFIPLTRY